MPHSTGAVEGRRSREIIRDGQHTTEALSALANEISDSTSLHIIAERAAKILEYAVDPVSGNAEPSYGLLYGLNRPGFAGGSNS